MMKCLNCGYKGEDVREMTNHVGGHGFNIHTGPFCEDRVACWQRWGAMQDDPAKLFAAFPADPEVDDAT